MNYKYIISIFFLLALSISCSEFLEEEPRDSLGVDQYFTEAGQAQSAVNYLYQNGVPQMYLSGGVFNGTRVMYLQYLSGFFDNEFNGQERQVDLAQQLLITPNNVDNDLNGMWEGLYRGIAGANLAIANIPETPGLTDNERANLTAQAKFFRGFGYFYLVRIFGDVPLILDPIENINEIYPSRDAVSVIYDQVLQDLTDAAIPGALPSGNMVNNGYRITTETVQMILSDVYLTMSGFPLQSDNYANAADAAREVINSGAFSLTMHDSDDDGNVIFEDSAYNQMRKELAIGNE
ncbi:MAG: RagB/SusD family nutrient uptake outer membrane protein, partial [Leeuwenhoekiella sp.]